MYWLKWVVRLALIAGICASVYAAEPAQAKQEYDLSWKLPHDKAAVYDVYELSRNEKTGEFCLLACELLDGVRPENIGEIGVRFLFRNPQAKVERNKQWTVKETLFIESGGGISPVEVSGSFRISAAKKAKLGDVLRSAKESHKGGEAQDLVVVEGILQAWRARRSDRGIELSEKSPSTSIALTIVYQQQDGAVVGGRYTLKGRSEDFGGLNGGTRVQKTEETREYVLRKDLLLLEEAALKTSIDLSVNRATQWLRRQQAGDGSFSDRGGYPLGTVGGLGSTALALQALLHAGIKIDDPTIRSALAHLAAKKSNQSYDLGAKIMAIEAKYIPLEALADIEAYSETAIRETLRAKVSKDDLGVVEEAAKLLIERQGRDGGFGYVSATDEPNLSNSQYALLGLKSASRMGVKVPIEVWSRFSKLLADAGMAVGVPIDVAVKRWGAEEVEVWKVAPRGWQYYLPRRASAAIGMEGNTSSMVTAAITCAAICASELRNANAADPALLQRLSEVEQGGIAWLTKWYGMRGSWPSGAWWGPSMRFMYCYSFERAMVLSRAKEIDSHNWFLEGAAVLLSEQKVDGRWDCGMGTPVIDTAFALLFLKKATIPVETPSRPKIATGDEKK